MEIAEEPGGCKTVGPGATVMGRYVIHLARAAQAVNMVPWIGRTYDRTQRSLHKKN